MSSSPHHAFRDAAAAVGLALVAASALAQSPLPADAPPAATRVPRATESPAAEREGLTPDLFYRILLGDVALQRGEIALAARAYLDAARETRDARLARRAT